MILVKQTYFGLAKLFHRTNSIVNPRPPEAYGNRFYGLHAYETRMTKPAIIRFQDAEGDQVRAKRRAEGKPEETEGTFAPRRLESFQQGLNFLNQEEYDQAAVLLGRGALQPDNAQFHLTMAGHFLFDRF
jgi:hypothetical protein